MKETDLKKMGAVACQLAENAKKLTFGTVGCVVHFHNGQIVKIDYSTTEFKRDVQGGKNE